MDTISTIESILKIPHAKRIFVWELKAKNVSTDIIESFYVTNISRLTTSPDDLRAPNKSFMSRLYDDLSISFAAGDSDRFTGFEGLVSGKISLDISDLTDKLKFLKDGTYDLTNQEAICYLGSDIHPTEYNKKMAFDQFVIIYKGKIQNSYLSEGSLIINLDDMSVFLNDKLSSDYFRSFGKGIEFTTTNYGFAYKDDRHAVEGYEFTLGLYFSIQAQHTSSEPLALISRGINDKSNYGIYITADNRIGVKSGNQILFSKKNVFELNKTYSLIAIKKNRALRLYIDGDFSFFDSYDTAKNHTELDEGIYVNTNKNNEYGNIRLFEFVVFDKALTEIEVSQFSKGPFPKVDLEISTEITAIRRLHYKFEDYGTLTGLLEPYIINELGTGMDLYIYNKDFPVVSNNSFEFDLEDTIGTGTISAGNTITAWTASDPTKVGRLRLLDSSIFDNGHTENGETCCFIQDSNYIQQSIYIKAGDYKCTIVYNRPDNGFNSRIRVDLVGVITGIIPTTIVTNVSSSGDYSSAFTQLTGSQFNIATSGFYTLRVNQALSGTSNYLLVDKVYLNSSPSGFSNPNYTIIHGQEGDDPEIFRESLVGKIQPLIYGNPRNITPIWLDTLNQTAALAKNGQVDLIYKGRVNGLPLVQDLDIPIDKMTFFPYNNSIKIEGFSQEKINQLIPGQLSPAYDGQTINIPTSGDNHGNLIISSIKDDKIFIASSLIQEELLFGNIVSIDPKFGFDNSLDAINLNAIGPGIEGQLTFDPKGTNQFKVSQIIKDILDKYFIKDDIPQEFTIDNKLLFDPYLNIYANEESKLEILKMCLDSCFGYMYKLSDGRIRLGTYQLPAEEPDFFIRETLIDDAFISEMNSVNPYWQIQIGYDKNYTVQTEDKLSPLLTIPDKRRYSKEYLYQPISKRLIFLKYPDAGLLKIDTYLGNRADACKLANLVFSLFRHKLLFYQIDSIRNFGKIMEPGQTVRIYSNTFFTTNYRDLFIKKAVLNYKTDSWSLLGYALDPAMLDTDDPQ